MVRQSAGGVGFILLDAQFVLVSQDLVKVHSKYQGHTEGGFQGFQETPFIIGLA